MHDNDIFVPNQAHIKKGTDINEDKQLLAHELTHVWQHQNGGTDYLTEALYAINFGDGYDLKKAILEDKNFAELNPEQQAVMTELIYQVNNTDRLQKSSDIYFDKIPVSNQIKEALYSIRNGLGAP